MEQLRNTLIQVINNSELPLDAKYYILKDLFRELGDQYYRALEEQKAKEEAAAGANKATAEPESAPE